jgi:serine protease
LLTTSNDGTQAAVGSIYTTGDNSATLGTSFSAPLVAGTVALMISANRTLTPGQVTDALKTTARAFPSSGAIESDGSPAVVACTAPGSVAQNTECYCTTGTCGAGLLDAGAAVAKVATLTANIAVASTSVPVSSPITLDGSVSYAVAAHPIATYQWSITDGLDIASFSSATNGASATLATSAAGSVTVSLTVTDSVGQTDTTTLVLTVGTKSIPIVPPPTPVDPPAATSSGGGAMELGWLLGWLASVIGVRLVTPRARREPR